MEILLVLLTLFTPIPEVKSKKYKGFQVTPGTYVMHWYNVPGILTVHKNNKWDYFVYYDEACIHHFGTLEWNPETRILTFTDMTVKYKPRSVPIKTTHLIGPDGVEIPTGLYLGPLTSIPVRLKKFGD